MRKAARRRPLCSDTCYWQQLPPSQQIGSPQQGLTVEAEADKDKSITAANTNDRKLIFIKSPLGFLQKNDTTIYKNEVVKCEPGERISLGSQIVLKLKNDRMIAQTRSQLALSHVDQKGWSGVVNTLKTQCETNSLRFALFFFDFFGDCDGRMARRTGFRRIVYWQRAARRVVRLT
jgi:hypothetical protein